MADALVPGGTAAPTSVPGPQRMQLPFLTAPHRVPLVDKEAAKAGSQPHLSEESEGVTSESKKEEEWLL